MDRTKGHTLGSNETIREAIRKIALHGLADEHAGFVYGTERFTGFVSRIHTEGELAGTVDVQEYVGFNPSDPEEARAGYHRGVYLSALKNNETGLLIVPKMYSEVVVSPDPETGRKYVSMFSHVDLIRLDSHDRITVGVTEREGYDNEDDSKPDVHELEETGVSAKTTYTKDGVVTEVFGEDDGKHTRHAVDHEKIEAVSGDDESSVVIDNGEVRLRHGDAETLLDGSQHLSQFGGSKVKIEDGTVYVGSDSGTDDAVLGAELADILGDIVGYISQMTTTTQIGPQPPLNVASFVSLKAKIKSFKATHSGFLTSKVKIQK